MLLLRMFPDDDTAERWFEKQRWPEGPVCPHFRAQYPPDHATALQGLPEALLCEEGHGNGVEQTGVSSMGHRYLCMAMANLKGVSNMTIHREPGIIRKAAGRLIQPVREAFAYNGLDYGGRW